MTSETTASRGRRVGQAVLIVALALVLEALLIAWVVAGVRSAAGDVEIHGALAQDALRATQSAITSGDVPAARRASERATDELDQATDAAMSIPMRIASLVPIPANPVCDAQLLVIAAAGVGEATAEVVDVYSTVSQPAPGAKRLFADGQIDFDALASLSESVQAIDETLVLAEEQLTRVQGTFPRAERLARARDDALAEIVPTLDAVDRLHASMPLLPAAVGSEGPRTYLVTILNQAELRASGGTPLSIALVSFDKGRLSIPQRNAVANLPWPNGFQLTWTGAPGSPFNDANGLRVAPFQNSNFHPDFRSAGRDLVSAWNATGFQKVDGVISIDITAIAAILKETGPIPTSPYGELNAANLGDKLLVEAYRTFADDQEARQAANQAVVAAMLDRLTSGDSLLSVVRGLGSVAPSRHFQVWMADESLQREVAALGIDGALHGSAGDFLAVFSQNANASKVDVFQQRRINVTARVRQDGSASITQQIKIDNATPRSLPATKDRSGYTTTWSGSGYYVYAPPQASQAQIQLPKGWVPLNWPGYRAWADDGHGLPLTRFKGEIAPRSTATVTINYDLPAGTFSTESGLVYSLRIDPQATYRHSQVSVRAFGPSGAVAVAAQVVDGTTDIRIPVT